MSDSVTVDVANVRDWKKFQDYQGLKRMLRIHCFPIGERHGTLSISFFKHAPIPLRFYSITNVMIPAIIWKSHLKLYKLICSELDMWHQPCLRLRSCRIKVVPPCHHSYYLWFNTDCLVSLTPTLARVGEHIQVFRPPCVFVWF